ncbi:MAG: hypothetical protein LH469_12680, partial [Frankiaceae bacterium]|nr:hypothetical protein [Frankiaceae bacterium]
AAVVGGVVLIGNDDSDATTASGAPFGMAHVHGLGIDPQDGALLAGTHYGAFRVDGDGSVEQVGPTQDFMGFTVAGADRYLASGHPGADQADAPPNLGLIESIDGGGSWSSLSLLGEADFHTLEARHDRVYGHAGGRLMVSQDKKTWDERASIAIADLAVSPDDPDTVIATTEQGLALSVDGGNTFSGVPNAPVMVLITWTDEGVIVGVDPQGAVHVSGDRGNSWQRRGTAGDQPAALTATAEVVYIATADGRIVESTDGGRTFDVRYQEAR